MPGGEVLHVDVVAFTGAVGGGIVATEDGELVPPPDRDLRDERQQVVGDALRVLPDVA